MMSTAGESAKRMSIYILRCVGTAPYQNGTGHGCRTALVAASRHEATKGGVSAAHAELVAEDTRWMQWCPH